MAPHVHKPPGTMAGTSLFTERALLAAFDAERTVVDPGSWNPDGDTVVSAPPELGPASVEISPRPSTSSGPAWAREPEPVWRPTDAVRARVKEFFALLQRDRTVFVLLAAGGFLSLALICFFATARWRYAVVVHSAHTPVAIAEHDAP